MKNRSQGEKGFVGLILLIIIALILAKFFYNFDVFQAAATPQGKATASYTGQLFNTLWSYVGAPLVFIWQKILWPILLLLWQSFQNFLAWGHTTASTPIR